MSTYAKPFKLVTASLSMLLLSGCLGTKDAGDTSTKMPLVFGTQGDDFARDVASDSAGVSYVVGETNRNSDTPARMFVSRIEQDGSLGWSLESTGNTDTYGETVSIGGDGNIYVAGFYGKGSAASYMSIGEAKVEAAAGEQTNLFVAKINPAGDALWLKSFDSGPLDTARGLAVDAKGAVYVSGDSATESGTHAFLRKLDEQGNTVWLSQFNSPEYASTNSVNVAKNGDLLITGSFSGAVSMGKEVIKSKGGYDAFAARISSDGGVLWARQLVSSTGNDSGYDIIELTDASVVVSGYYTGTAEFAGKTIASKGGNDAYVAALSAGGEALRLETLGGNRDDYAYSMDIKGDNFVLTGRYTGSLTIGDANLQEKSATGLFITEMTPTLSPLWSLSNPSTGTYYSYAVSVRPGGSLLVAAYFEDDISLDGNVLRSKGMNDAIVYVLKP